MLAPPPVGASDDFETRVYKAERRQAARAALREAEEAPDSFVGVARDGIARHARMHKGAAGPPARRKAERERTAGPAASGRAHGQALGGRRRVESAPSPGRAAERAAERVNLAVLDAADQHNFAVREQRFRRAAEEREAAAAQARAERDATAARPSAPGRAGARIESFLRELDAPRVVRDFDAEIDGLLTAATGGGDRPMR